MFRIYRDIRFSKDKTPYKTHASAHFPLSRAKDVHAPGYYLHLSLGEVFSGGGIWRPEPPTLGQIRDFLANHPRQWKAMLNDRNLKRLARWKAKKLVRPPKGYSPDHELIEYLKYTKTLLFSLPSPKRTPAPPNFMDRFVESCRAARLSWNSWPNRCC